MGDTYSHYSRIVENYARYRPRYPERLVDLLRAECGLAPEHTVADVGTGTGQLAELFLRNGNRVYGVEPNPEMLAAAVLLLRAYPAFTGVAAPAEATSLPDRSVDFVAVGNAFHWFEHGQARREFARLLVPDGWVVLVWNLERNNGSPFADAFEHVWRTYIDPSARFGRGGERALPAYLTDFFGAGNLHQTSLDNRQVCDLTALQGLAQSFLKAPRPGDQRHTAMQGELQALFEQYQQDGVVTLEYDTAVVYGRLKKE
ncbi:MAG TPA: class I SAM-dependent methyltransferase [Roseiflexaceae bacterium]|nr:class I SAM-dependent methyltransferase [Roseiflexaceae bacterium]